MFCNACNFNSSPTSTAKFMSPLSSCSSVLNELSLISSGTIAPLSYNNLNGVNFVVLDSVMLCDHITLGNSSGHFPLANPMIFCLMLVNIIPLALSAAPLDCGRYTKVKHNIVPKWEKILELYAIKLLSIVYCQLIWDTKSTHHIMPKEYLYLLRGYHLYCLCLNPLGEVFYY